MRNFEIYRFGEDAVENYKKHLIPKKQENIDKRMELLAISLKITKDITPSLYKITENIKRILDIDDATIEFYVYPHNEINASCFLVDENIHLAVMLSASLVNLTNDEELSFVIGHEIGHYIFGHLNYAAVDDGASLFQYFQAREISADRIGLICSSNINSSLRAIVKIISGLDDKYISNNLHTFLHQHNAIDGYSILASTHPTLPTRAKALTLFSMSELYYDFMGETKKAPIANNNLDQLIIKYLNQTSLKMICDAESELIVKFNMWLIAKIYLSHPNMTKDTFVNLAKDCKLDKIDNLIRYIETNQKEAIDTKYKKAKNSMDGISQEAKKKNLERIDKIFKLYGIENSIKLSN